MQALRINHVLSARVRSAIFDAILRRFADHLPPHCQLAVSEQPIPGMDLYHYHRPHRATRVLTPAVATVHHDLDESDQRAGLAAMRRVLSQCAAIVCLNHGQARLLADQRFPRVQVIPHGFDPRVFPAPIHGDVADEKLTLGVFSRRYAGKVKGEAYFSELLLRLDRKRFSFVFVGHDRTEDWQRAHQLGFSARVHEYLPYPLFQELYKQIDALLVCSAAEGGPACIPEALAAGRPILTTPVGMAPDLVQHGQNGIILSGVVERDAQLLSALSKGSPAWSRLVSHAQRARSSVLTWAEVVEQHARLYAELVTSSVEQHP